ncbi:hypothetical protein BCR36DRAFT_410986 [Piromyces finnis]|uniref:BRCT domain-containing protein n=1 Tax=Piromyces finnis TaxID=1754191 RepID=A0A1Y1VFW1_9FUNG|nr:hypothetical protein BCR36DRAFT_410986 [Piromyces finnis]|eukprot:ORX53841.1 hypothetical protein BCR36DRAFT_410986 [Piromyces finnis]
MDNNFKLPELQLFSNLNIYLDESNSFTLNYKLKEKLIKEGANIVDTVNIDKNKILNYYITNDINHELKSITNFNIVTPSWVDISIKTNIVQNPIYFSPDLSLFFSGVIATAIGIDERDCKEIYSSIETFGGQWSPTYKKGVTHVITLFDSINIKDSDEDVKIILPHWFEDCVKLKRKIPEKIYLHPNPILLQFSTKDINELYFKEQAIEFIEPTYPYLKDKKLYIDPDIKKNGEFEKCSNLLKESGVKTLDNNSIDQSDYIVLKNKNNINYIKNKSIKDIPIVTEFWLYDVLRQKRIIRPYSKLCYSFLEFLDLPKMENFTITITNYHGQARKYIIQLIYALGAKFTSNMTTDNTHIICGECTGKKYEKAVEWNIEIVNHLWLEDCYRNRCVQAITKPIYTYYPPQLNAIVGNIFVEWNNHQHIVYLFQQGLTSSSSSVTPPTKIINDEIPKKYDNGHLEENRKKKKNTILQYETHPAISPQPFKNTKLIPEEKSLDSMTYDSTSLIKTSLSKKNKLSQMPGKGKNQAQDKLATKKIASNKNLSDENNSMDHQKEEENGEIRGGSKKRKNSVDEALNKKLKKKENIISTENPIIINSDENTNKNNSISNTNSKDFSSIPTSKDKIFNVMFTGTKPTEQDIKKIKSLGGNVVKNINTCTHLLSKKIAKTEKFLIGISLCKHIIHYDWLSYSYLAGRMLDESFFPLKDELNEKEFSFSLQESLKRSQQKKLLENLTFIVTPNAFPSLSVLSRIISSAGGKINQENYLNNPNNIPKDNIIISSTQDKNLWSFYRSAGFKIYNVEFLLIGILRQYLSFKNKTFIFSDEI